MGNEWQYVKDCIDTGWVSSVGEYVNQFETKLATFTGVRHSVAVVNGTAALHICLILADVQAQDEVFVPSLTSCCRLPTPWLIAMHFLILLIAISTI